MRVATETLRHVLPAFLCTAAIAAADPLPYAPIANPLPDTLDQLYRDSANIRIGRLRVNQAGYRPIDEKYFYHVSSAAPSGFAVVDAATGVTAGSGTLAATGLTSSSQLQIRASNNAQIVTGGDTRYVMQSPVVAGSVYEGKLPELPPGKYQITVGSDMSAPFVVNANVYGWVRDALLKFYGVNRCGDSQSWFHPPCHLQDAVAGGWHDCGDHLKEGITQGYAAAVLGLAAAAFADRDRDVYAANHSFTVNTDGIPDVLYEAKHGCDYILRSYRKAGGNVAAMITSIGNFGNDHSWWGRPEFQDKMPTSRGGPPREARNETGANILGDFAAGLAFVSKQYARYDASYAAECLKAARALYTYAKANQKSTETPAYNGNGTVNDELAFAAVALLWATGEKGYLQDLCYDKTIGPMGNPFFAKLSFDGGWFEATNIQFSHDLANTDWASVHVYALWAFFRLILNDQTVCGALGISPTQRLALIERTAYQLIYNVAAVGKGTQSIELPDHGVTWGAGGHAVKYGKPWFTMHTQQEWVWNRYQAGNITELFCYYDVASKIQGLALPNTPASADWKAADVKRVLVRQLDYMLGVNPWDLSIIYGVGSKSFNHPHHRAANPEGKNVPGALYRYRPPTGALQGGYSPEGTGVYAEHYDDYYHSETGIDGTTNILLPVIGLSAEERLGAPDATVRIVYVGHDQAIVEVRQSRFGTSTIRYGENKGAPSLERLSDSAGVVHRIMLSSLKNGTTYYFDVLVKDLLGNDTTITDHGDYFTFTTLQNRPGAARITNVKVCAVTSDSAEIFWYTPDGEYDSKVVYGERKPPSTVSDGDVAGHPVKFHFVKIGGLKERTTYYFAVESGGTRDDNGGAYYTFTTPVEYVKFDVRAVSYGDASAPFLGINVINQDVKSYDSLELRIYLRSTEAQIKDFAAAVDVGIQYNEAGFQGTHFKGALDPLIQAQHPVKIADTYEAASNTWAWYLALPLGPVVMNSGSRFRLDVRFRKRNLPWDENLLMDPPTHVPGASSDWSWMPHSRAAGAPADFGGIKQGLKTDLDNNYWNTEIDPYITVYRKGQFVWGFSPSASEQRTRRTTYQMTAQITDPLSNPTQEYVALEQVVPVVKVKGWATITEGGVVNDVWVNGARLTNVARAAIYDPATGKWNLDIPVPVKNGANVVDITIFGGPELSCTECYGCAYSNHHFYVDFRGAAQYPSRISLTDTAGKPLGDTARIDTTAFLVTVGDWNGNGANRARDTLYVAITNPTARDSISLELIETGDSTGVFTSAVPVRVVSGAPGTHPALQISMSGGERVVVTYIDPTDPSDKSEAYLVSVANFPVAQRAAVFDSDGDGRIDQVKVVWSKPLTSLPDSVALQFPNASSVRVARQSTDSMSGAGALLTIGLQPPLDGPATGFDAGSGLATSYLGVSGTTRQSVFPVYDSAGPVLVNRAVVFEARSGAPVETLMVSFSERIAVGGIGGDAFLVRRNGTDTPLRVTRAFYDSSLQNVYVIVPPGAFQPAAGDSLRINSAGPLADLQGNRAHRANPPVPIVFRQAPPDITAACYRDRNADGKIDIVETAFSKEVKTEDLSAAFSFHSGTRLPVAQNRLSYGSDGQILVDIGGLVAGADSIATGGSLQITFVHRQFPSESIGAQAADSAAPVVVRAIFSPAADTAGGTPDTLVVTFSEEVSPVIDTVPFRFVSAGTAYSMSLVNSGKADLVTQTFLVKEIRGVQYPRTGDSLWIEPAAGVFDRKGNVQLSAVNRHAPLTVKQWPITLTVRAGPNPFSPSMDQTMTVVVKATARAPSSMTLSGTISIYDALGNSVAGGPMQSRDGVVRFVWDGRSRNGRLVGSGTYVGLIEAQAESGQTVSARVKLGVKR